MKNILIIIFILFSISSIAKAENLIENDVHKIINYKNIDEKTRDLIKNKSLVFETNTWIVNCDNEKCQIITTWIYDWDIKLNSKLKDKIIKTDYFKIDKTKQIVNNISFKNDRTIKKDLEIIYSYWNLNLKEKEYIKNWEINISSNKWEIICKNELCAIKSDNIYSWNISIKIKNKTKVLKEYIFKINKFPEYLDISNKFKYKSIQKYDLSCEISATSDILSSILSKKISEDELIEKIDKSNFYWKKAISYKWQRLWWNPNDWFVWSIDNAMQWKYTWYWVLEKPISKIYYLYWIVSKIITKENYNNTYSQKEHLRELLIELNKWNYVQLWWDYLTNPAEEDWKKVWKISQIEANNWLNWKNYAKTWNLDRRIYWNYMKDGKLYEHVWLNWEHAFYLLWYEWSIDNPKKIIVWDTKTGKHKYSLKEWLRKWNAMQNRSIIINWN